MAKYIRAIEIIDSFAEIAGGNGGYWEDRGYDCCGFVKVAALFTSDR
jgi:hypothetical protein